MAPPLSQGVLYVKGMPAPCNEDRVKEVLGQYGPVKSVKVLAPHPLKSGVTAIVSLENAEQAKALKAKLRSAIKTLEKNKQAKFSGIQQMGPNGDCAPASGATQGILKGTHDPLTSDLGLENADQTMNQKQ